MVRAAVRQINYPGCLVCAGIPGCGLRNAPHYCLLIPAASADGVKSTRMNNSRLSLNLVYLYLALLLATTRSQLGIFYWGCWLDALSWCYLTCGPSFQVLLYVGLETGADFVLKLNNEFALVSS